MVNVIIIFGSILSIFVAGVFVMQCLNRQEMLTQREDIEMIRFRLKTINSELEEVLGILKAAQTPAEEKQKLVPVEATEEDIQELVKSYQKDDEDYGFKTAPADIAPKREERIEYEEENFVIEEDE